MKSRETPFIPPESVARPLLLVPSEKGKRRMESHPITEYFNVTLCYSDVSYCVILKNTQVLIRNDYGYCATNIIVSS